MFLFLKKSDEVYKGSNTIKKGGLNIYVALRCKMRVERLSG